MFHSNVSMHFYWPWFAGLTLLCFSIAIAIIELPALQSQNTLLERQIHALDVQLRMPLVSDPLEEHRKLRTQLETLDSLPALANDLQSLATQNGLIVSAAPAPSFQRIPICS